MCEINYASGYIFIDKLNHMVMSQFDLSLSPLFKNISKEEIHLLLERAVEKTLTFEKNQHVVRQGDVIHHLYFLVDGIVRTEMITKEGNVLEIEFIEAVRPLAPAFLFASENKFPVDVITMQPSTFYMIPKERWMAEMMRNEKLMTNFLEANSNITVFLSRKLQMLSIKSLKGKLSLYFLENTTPENNSFYLKRTQTQLAEYFGVQRPSLARSLGEMLDEKVITLENKKLTILNRAKLESFI